MDSHLSIIIRNKNEERYIGYAIQSCLDFFKNPEIIVVDNSSMDDSMDVASLFEYANLRFEKIDDYTPGKAINFGANQASFDHLLVLSAHSEITSLELRLDTIKQLLDERYAAVFGNQIPVYRGKRISKRYIWSHFVDHEVVNMWSDIENRYFLHNAFCFYHKDELITHPFDERLSGKEDRYWAKDIVELKKQYLYTPKLTCKHHWTPNGNTWKGLG